MAAALTALASLASQPVVGAQRTGPRPALATDAQLSGEALALRVLANPAVRRAMAQVRPALAADPATQDAQGKAGVDATLRRWTLELVLKFVGRNLGAPAFLLDHNDTPRRWLGRTFPGDGTIGDNPDNIYRTAQIDGARRYELRGRLPAHGPAQLTLDLGREVVGGGTGGTNRADLGNQLGLLSDSDIVKGPDHSFIITIDPDPADGRPNHLRSAPGPLRIFARDTLSDWTQQASILDVRCLDCTPQRPASVAAIARQVADALPVWVAGWARLNNTLSGPPPVNRFAAKVTPRDGGFGYLAHMRYELSDDQAFVITLATGGAQYLGFHLTDRWSFTPNPGRHFISRSNSQVTPNPDGTITYVVSKTDPGTANWISTAGFGKGWIRLRWQGASGSIEPAQLIRSYAVVSLATLTSHLPASFPRVTQKQREMELAQRRAAFESRWVAR
jgi:hypothetical protein